LTRQTAIGAIALPNKTIHDAWAAGRDQLAQASLSPELDARLLLEHVLRVSHSYLIAHGDERLGPAQEEAYETLLSRAAEKEPIPYLTGKAPFYGLDLHVEPSVLIPRPETEELVERALSWGRQRGDLNAVDVGTGSGCIAVVLSQYLPSATITAVDLSYSALKIARLNAQRHARRPIHLVQGNLLEPFAGPFDLIVANLPYIAADEWTLVDDAVKWYEPLVALDGGADGLVLLRELLQQAAFKLHPGGAVFLEIGWQQGPATQQLAGRSFPHADTTEAVRDARSRLLRASAGDNTGIASS
jgi:release factor glutamine methyltransferase